MPDAPTALAAVGDAGAVGLTWAAPASDGGSAIISYRVYRREAAATLELIGTAVGVLQYVDATAVPGTDYFYAVSAENAVAEGPASAEASAFALLFMPAVVTVPAGTFTMGYVGVAEPLHAVTLSSYDIGTFEVTNGEYAAVLNWALAKGYPKGDAAGNAYAGGNVYAGGQLLLEVTSSYCQISFSDGAFSVEVRDGLPQDDHPVVKVNWYGAVAFCNWLSESNGMAPWYDLTTWAWTGSSPDGYRLPTEAEWERAAAWDVVAEPAKAWTYGFGADSIDSTRCNYYGTTWNPLGFSGSPWTTPVGYYNGSSGSRVDGPSPAGCYDMSGNVCEWCHDWYAAYTADTQTDPTGPGTGSYRVLRGGSWGYAASYCRAAYRGSSGPAFHDLYNGFRVVVSPSRGE